MIAIRSSEEIELMRAAGKVVARVLDELESLVKPGVTTLELDEFAENRIGELGAEPAFLGLYGYPNTVCASLNGEVVHGIPDSRKLKSGDILSVDVGAGFGGFFGDAARTYPVGSVSALKKKLMDVTEESLGKGIAAAVVDNRVSDISHAVQSHVEANGFSVVRAYVGHGIGRQFHEEPQVPNFGRPGEGPELRPGMALAIEPMVNAGDSAVKVLEDGWTAVTKDGKPSAHFEHTVVVTEGPAEILTGTLKREKVV